MADRARLRMPTPPREVGWVERALAVGCRVEDSVRQEWNESLTVVNWARKGECQWWGTMASGAAAVEKL